jgi:tRNA (guanosine-2'-O-)-methyltransferase
MNDEIKNTLIAMLSAERLGRIDSVLDHRTSGLTILLDRIHHPHNIAAVLRSADAFGLKTVHLIESTAIDVTSVSEAQKSPGISLGSEKWVEVVRHTSGPEALHTLKSQGFTVVTLTPPPLPSSKRTENQKKNLCVTDLPFENKLCLLFGSELEGVDPELEAVSDLSAHIPMYGFVESFNISVACAITLFCSVISKTHPERRTAFLSPSEKEKLRNDWIKKSIPRSEEVVAQLEKRAPRHIES